jgi:hypothetical protein
MNHVILLKSDLCLIVEACNYQHLAGPGAGSKVPATLTERLTRNHDNYSSDWAEKSLLRAQNAIA